MVKKRRRFKDEQKARIALTAIKGESTINQIASQNAVHPNQINRWKRELIQNAPLAFSQDKKHQKDLKEKDDLIQELYQIIGQRDFELEWLKKKLI